MRALSIVQLYFTQSSQIVMKMIYYSSEYRKYYYINMREKMRNSEIIIDLIIRKLCKRKRSRGNILGYVLFARKLEGTHYLLVRARANYIYIRFLEGTFNFSF